MDIGDFVPGIKRPEREADHSPSSNAEIKMVALFLHSPIGLHDMVQ
jgi:hypothetical protein